MSRFPGTPVVKKSRFQGTPVNKDLAHEESYGDRVARRKEGYSEHMAGIQDRGLGIVEPLMAFGSGVVADTVGNIYGGIEAYNPVASNKSPLRGPEEAARVKEALTYVPRSETAQRVMQGYNETLAPVVEPIAEAVESARLGDETLDILPEGTPVWLRETLAKNAEAIPEYIMAALTATGLHRPTQSVARTMVGRKDPPPIGQLDKYGNMKSGISKNATIAQNLRNNPGRGGTARHDLIPGTADKYGNLQMGASTSGREAITQGWDDITVAGVKAANPATQSKIREMAEVAWKRLTQNSTAETKITTRPSNVAGRSLMNRYRFIKEANRASGKLMSRIAKEKTAAGVRVDVNNAVKWLGDQLEQYGVKIIQSRNGKYRVDFSNFKLAKSDRGMIQENIEQLARFQQKQRNGTLTFSDAHELKQIMRRTGVSYKQTVAKTGASEEAQGIFKGFSRKIDEVLDSTSSAYDAQNIKFGKTRDALDAVNDIARKNMFTESPETALGTLTRRMMGNPTSRQAVIEYSRKLDDIAREYGGKFDDDLFLQAYVAHDMDKVVEIAAGASLKGDAAAALANQVDKSVIGSIAHGADTLAKIAGRKSEVKALNTLKALTKQVKE